MAAGGARAFIGAVAAAALSAMCAASAQAQDASPAPSPPSSTAPATQPKCDAACVRANTDRAAQACARSIEAQAPIDYEWMNRPFEGLFQEADPSDDKSAVARYRGDSIRFLSPRKEWVRVTYECSYDTDAKKLVGVRVRPGRLPTPPNVVGAPPQSAGNAPKIDANKLAAAIKAAAANRGKTPRSVRPGEPSPIDIQQINPSH